MSLPPDQNEPTQPSLYGEKHNENSPKRKVSARTKDIISRLFLRYRPSNSTDLEAHAARMAIFCEDVSDLPPKLLDRACEQWARSSKFQPTVAEIISLSQGYLDASRPAHATLSRVEALRQTIPQWNKSLYRERPDLDPCGPPRFDKYTKAEWHVSDAGQAAIIDLSRDEITDRQYTARFASDAQR